MYSYDPDHASWSRYGPHSVDRSLSADIITDMSMYIRNPSANLLLHICVHVDC